MHPIVWMEDNKKEPRLQHLLQIVGIFYSAKTDPNHPNNLYCQDSLIHLFLIKRSTKVSDDTVMGAKTNVLGLPM